MHETIPVVVHFPAFAGGKFILNCLSYSKHCITSDPNIIDTDDYKIKHNSILTTLPSKEKMNEWVSKYEFHEIVKKVNKDRIKNKKKMFFYTAHNLVSANEFLTKWENCILLSLTNFWNFQKLAQGLKDPNYERPVDFGNEQQSKYDLLRGEDWPDYKSFEANGFYSSLDEIQEFYPTSRFKKRLTFDIDTNIMDTSKFLQAIEMLYKKLGLTDFDSTKDFIKEYHTKYIFLHQ